MRPRSAPAGVADLLVDLLRLAQDEGMLVAGDVWTDLHGVKSSVAAARRRAGADVHVYVGDDVDNPLIITVGRLRSIR